MFPFNPYYPYNNPYAQQANTAPTQPTQPVIRVNGQAGANALQMAPNSSVIVADESDGNRLFLCMTDGAGFKTVRAIRCQFEDIETQETKYDALDKRLTKLEGIINEHTSSNTATIQPNV